MSRLRQESTDNEMNEKSKMRSFFEEGIRWYLLLKLHFLGLTAHAKRN